MSGPAVTIVSEGGVPVTIVSENGVPVSLSDNGVPITPTSNATPVILSGYIPPTPPPLSLFANGENGVWFDPSDLSTLFQDAAGTIPVTAAGQVVGLMRDKSGRGNHAMQSAAARKPILRQDGSEYYIEFDGVDDFLATNSIDFTGTDEMTVIAGLRKLSDNVGTVAELSAATGANPGTFNLSNRDFDATTGAKWFFLSRGSVISHPSAEVAAVGALTDVLTGQGKISTDVMALRVNGAQASSVATNQGTGNYGNYPLYIGRRGGMSLPFNGNIYGLIIVGRSATEQEINTNETWMNAKTGAY